MSTVPTVVTTPKYGDGILWAAFDAAGWRALESFAAEKPTSECGCFDPVAFRKKRTERLFAARTDFTKAIQFADGVSRRAARSQIGLAWVRYLLLIQETSPTPPRFDDLLATALDAAKQLSDDDAERGYRTVKANASYLIGLLYLETCQGDQAGKALENAANHYRAEQIQEQYLAVRHLQAKLAQCRQEHAPALLLLSEVEGSGDDERRVRAFLDRVNTLLWLGQTREAWLSYQLWIGYARKLDPAIHASLLLRGRMLFALVATRLGALTRARAILDEISCSLACRDVPHSFCTATLAIIRATYLLETGDVVGAIRCLDKLSWETPLSRQGYDCFEILFLDSSCQLCVTCSWTRQAWCCNSCGCCEPKTIVFHTEAKPVPVDLQRMLKLMSDGLRAKAQIANGDLAQAESRLRKVIEDIQSIFPADSTIDIPYRVALLRVLQLRDNDGPQIQNLVNDLLAKLQGLLKRRNALPHHRHADESDILRALGLWRSELSEDEVAVDILNRALLQALSARDSLHPEVLALQSELVQIRAQLPDADLAVLAGQISRIISQFDGVVDCLDYRRLGALRTAAWILLLQGCFQAAVRCFNRLELQWLEMQVRNEAGIQIEDSRVIFGRLAAEVEIGTPWELVTAQLHRGILRIAANSTLSSLAHDLNRLALVLLAHRHYRSAYYFARKSLDQYESMKDTANANVLRTTIQQIEKQAAQSGVNPFSPSPNAD